MIYDPLAYGLGMGSWHVHCARSVSHDGRRRDMGYVTSWALRGDHLAFMSHDGCGYPVLSLGQDGCSMDYVMVTWHVGYAWAVGMWTGHWLCHFTGIDRACEMSYEGHDYLSRRLDIGSVIRGEFM